MTIETITNNDREVIDLTLDDDDDEPSPKMKKVSKKIPGMNDKIRAKMIEKFTKPAFYEIGHNGERIPVYPSLPSWLHEE